MKLDPRIKSLSDIITCFDDEKARQFIGQNGYFSDDMMEFNDLNSCVYGELEDYSIGDDYPFRCKDGIDHAFFIPENKLKPKKKKYRPYTLMEFTEKFTMGQPIKYRRKGNVGWERYLMLMSGKNIIQRILSRSVWR